MKHITQSFVCFFVFTIILSSFSVFNAMEITPAGEIEIDWGYKKRDNMTISYFQDRDSQLYPYFLLPHERREKVSEDRIIEKYKKTFGTDTYIDNFNRCCTISSLNEENKKALCYVLQLIDKQGIIVTPEKLRIEGRDKHFSRIMSERIVRLPVAIRKEVTKKTDRKMICNTSYEPSYAHTILDDELNKEICAHAVSYSETCCCFCVLEHSFLKYFGNTDILGLHCVFSTIASSGFGYCVFKKIKDCLRETPESKDKRHGFKELLLLQDMEYKIVEAKEKED